MVKFVEDEALKPKLEKWRSRYTSANNDARKRNLDTAAEKKGRIQKIYDEVERAGIPLTAFKNEMKMLDHADKARGVRADVVAEDDRLATEAFDRLTVLAEEALPLFDKATISEIKSNAKKRPPEDDDEEDAEEDAKADAKSEGTGAALQ